MFDIDKDHIENILISSKPYFENTIQKYKTLEESKKHIHREFKNQITIAKERWWLICWSDWSFVEMDHERIEKYINSVKFMTLSIINACEYQWYTKISDVLQYLQEKIK